MTTRISILCLCIATALAQPATAQAVVDSALSDLNGDGLRERFTLLDDGDGSADLIIEDTGIGRITTPDLAWIGGIGQEPEVDLAENGSVRITSMNDSIGRNRWHLTLTIAHRNGTYMVVGFTYDYHDTLNPDENGSCDLNLLTGRGFVERGQKATRAVLHDVAALPVTSWNDGVPIPDVCQTRD